MLPIVIGGLALAWMREGSPEGAVVLAVQGSGVALVIALAAWLLVTQAFSDGEHHVFALGGLLLLGGAAEYLSLSALLAGFVAGVFWSVAGGPACDRIRRDVYHVQHPLIFLLLVDRRRSCGLHPHPRRTRRCLPGSQDHRENRRRLVGQATHRARAAVPRWGFD